MSNDHDRFAEYWSSPTKSAITRFFSIHYTERNLLWIVDVVLAAHLPYKWTIVRSEGKPLLYRSSDNVFYRHHPALAFYGNLISSIRHACTRLDPASRYFFYTQRPPNLIIDIFSMMYYLGVPYFTDGKAFTWKYVWVAMVALCTPPSALYYITEEGTYRNEVTRETYQSNPDDEIFYELAKSGIEQVGSQIVPQFTNSKQWRVGSTEMLVYSFETMYASIIGVREAFAVQRIRVPYFELQWDLHENILEGVRAASGLLFAGASPTSWSPLETYYKAKRLIYTNNNLLVARPDAFCAELAESTARLICKTSSNVKSRVLEQTLDSKPQNQSVAALHIGLGRPPGTIMFSAVSRLSDWHARNHLLELNVQKSGQALSSTRNALSTCFQTASPSYIELRLRIEFSCGSALLEQGGAKPHALRSQNQRSTQASITCPQGVLPELPSLPQCYLTLFLNGIPVPAYELRNSPLASMSLADLAIGLKFTFQYLEYVIIGLDSASKQWFVRSLARIAHVREVLEAALLERGKRATVCSVKYFERQYLESCAISIRSAVMATSELYQMLRDAGIAGKYTEIFQPAVHTDSECSDSDREYFL